MGLAAYLASGVLASRLGHRALVVRVGKHEDAIIVGREYRTFFINNDGWLYRHRILRNGQRQILNFILPRETFGLQAYVFNKSPFSVTALTKASLSAIPFGNVDSVFKNDCMLAKSLFETAIYESVSLAEHAINIARRSAHQRIAYFLLDLLVRQNGYGRKVKMGFDMPLTQELIADALGLTTVHVNRTLRSLRDDKLVTIEGMHVKILDYDHLTALADFNESYLCDSVATHIQMPVETTSSAWVAHPG